MNNLYIFLFPGSREIVKIFLDIRDNHLASETRAFPRERHADPSPPPSLKVAELGCWSQKMRTVLKHMQKQILDLKKKISFNKILIYSVSKIFDEKCSFAPILMTFFGYVSEVSKKRKKMSSNIFRHFYGIFFLDFFFLRII